MRKEQGFTLIELLVVIVILGILAGIVIAVINPAQQQRRANEGVIKENVAKIGLALNACATSTQAPTTDCADATSVGVTLPNQTPTGSTYTITVSGSDIRVDGNLPNGTNTCTYRHSINTSSYLTTRSVVETATGACVGSW